MAARVLVEREAIDRLSEMSLRPENIERPVRLAEAESATCTALDPPITAGFLRYARTTRFLREELVPRGWDWDNPSNFCRVIDPDRKFVIVATSGDAATGDSNYTPTTKYPKGYATAQAVGVNGQLTLDFSDFGLPATPQDEDGQLATWFLLYHRTDTEIRVELSLPSAMTGGNISHWEERIILPPFCLDEPPLSESDRPEDEGGEFVVEVNRR